MSDPSSSAHVVSAVGPGRRELSLDARGRRFAGTLLGGLVAAVCYYGYTANVADPLNLYQGITILILAILPSIIWARHPSQQFPTFEMYLATFSTTYAIPLLSGQTQLRSYTVDDITSAAWGVLLFQLVACAAFFATKGYPKRTKLWREEVLSLQYGRFLGYAFGVNSIYVVVSIYYNAIPDGLVGPMRAIFFGIGIICTFIQSLRWGQGTLPRIEKVYFLVNAIFQVLVLTSTLFLVNGLSIVLLGLAGYISGARRIPVILCLVIAAIFGVLHSGKSEIRAHHWMPESMRLTHGFSDIPSLYLEWFDYGLHPKLGDDDNVTEKASLLERTSLFHMMCLVVSNTPDRKPFLDGITYEDIPGQFVPRLFWPDKPQAHVSTTRLGIYYGLQDADTASKTTIGFGVLTEAYANFGFFGIGLVAGIIGFALRKIRIWSAYSPLLSYPGIFTVLLMSWCFATELTMSIWLSSFYQACVAVIGSIFVARNFFK
jgi:MFS family permease